jgi:hypothetical protein
VVPKPPAVPLNVWFFSYIINSFIKLRSLVLAARSLLPPEREREGGEGEKERAPEKVRKIWI